MVASSRKQCRSLKQPHQEGPVLKETAFGKNDFIGSGISFGRTFPGCGISVGFICQSYEVTIAEHPSGVIILSALLQRQDGARSVLVCDESL